MTLLKRWWARILATLRPRCVDDEFRAELESHLQFMIDERMRRGIPKATARREAVVQLGGIAQLQESHRDWRGIRWLQGTKRDFFQAYRSLRRDSRFLLLAISVSALGIGAGTAVFSVVQHSFFRALPYHQPDRLLSIGITLPWMEQEFLFGRAWVQLIDGLDASPFEQVTSALGVQDCELDLDGVRRRIPCARVEGSFLRVLGVRPVRGRDFTDADDQPGAPPVVLLSHQFWTTAYGADPSVVGRAVSLDDTNARIVGVLPAKFELPGGEAFDILTPQKIDKNAQRVASPGRPLRVIGRLSETRALPQLLLPFGLCCRSAMRPRMPGRR